MEPSNEIPAPPLRQKIFAAYLSHLQREGRPPASVFQFCDTGGFSERDFFSEFPSLEGIEVSWWAGTLEKIIASVEGGAEWSGFSARHRMLAFLFAFVEASIDFRSLLLLRLQGRGILTNPAEFNRFQDHFLAFAKRLLDHGRSSGEIASRGPLGRIYPQAAYRLFRSVIDFHLRDTSPRFERTDAFIEKSTGVLFDLMGKQVLDSGFDLLRFLLPQWTRHAP
jgi:hypothetical protein